MHCQWQTSTGRLTRETPGLGLVQVGTGVWPRHGMVLDSCTHTHTPSDCHLTYKLIFHSRALLAQGRITRVQSRPVIKVNMSGQHKAFMAETLCLLLDSYCCIIGHASPHAGINTMYRQQSFRGTRPIWCGIASLGCFRLLMPQQLPTVHWDRTTVMNWLDGCWRCAILSSASELVSGVKA